MKKKRAKSRERREKEKEKREEGFTTERCTACTELVEVSSVEVNTEYTKKRKKQLLLPL